jgi:FMN phosphatase YigB (HAD superfamily)
VDTVIFDVGGVLIENPDPTAHRHFARWAGADEGSVAGALEDLAPLLQTGHVTEEEFVRLLGMRLGKQLPLIEPELWLRDFRFEVVGEVAAIVRELRGGGYRLAILSDTIRPHQTALERAGVYGVFDDVVLSPDIGCVKADGAEAFWIASLRQDRSPQACLFIDDKEKNISNARRSKMRGIHFRSPRQLRDELVSRGLLPVR